MNPFEPANPTPLSSSAHVESPATKRFPWMVIPALLLAMLCALAAAGVYWQSQQLASDLGGMPAKFQANNDSLVQSQKLAAVILACGALVAVAAAVAEKLQQRTMSVIGIVLCVAMAIYVVIQFKPA